MFKKILLGSAIAAGGTVVVLGTSAMSYVRTGVHTLRQEVKNQIPVEVEIKRCRDMISQIDPEIARNLQSIAREEVEIERLQKEVATKKSKLETAKSHIMRLKSDLSENRTHYVYASRNFTADQVRKDLTRCFDAYKSKEQNIDQLDKILIAREEKLQAARSGLDQMLSSKRQLEVEVENLEARNTMVKVVASSTSFSVDDSQLTRTRELVDEIVARLDVAERMASNEGIPFGAIPVDEPATSDVLSDIATYFSEKEKVQHVAVDGDASNSEELTDL